MRINFKNIPCCIAILFVLIAGTSAAENDYIIGKEEDKNLLTLSIVFFVLCAVFFLVSLVASVVLIKKMKRSGGGGGYYLEEQEERYQSMYDGKSYGENEFPLSQYETLQINGSGNGIYQSLDSNEAYQLVDYEQASGEPKTKQGTPPGTEQGQKDTKENEKQKTLSSFHNPAYEASVPYGLNKEVEFKPVTSDVSEQDTAL